MLDWTASWNHNNEAMHEVSLIANFSCRQQALRSEVQHLPARAQSEQFAVCMSQVVGATPGDFGIPVIGVLRSVAVSALEQACCGGGWIVMLLYIAVIAKLA